MLRMKERRGASVVGRGAHKFEHRNGIVGEKLIVYTFPGTWRGDRYARQHPRGVVVHIKRSSLALYLFVRFHAVCLRFRSLPFSCPSVCSGFRESRLTFACGGCTFRLRRGPSYSCDRITCTNRNNNVAA